MCHWMINPSVRKEILMILFTYVNTTIWCCNKCGKTKMKLTPDTPYWAHGRAIACPLWWFRRLLTTRSISQIPQCTNPKFHNAPHCNGNMHMFAPFCYKVLQYGIFVWCIMRFFRWVWWSISQRSSQQTRHSSPFRNHMAAELHGISPGAFSSKCNLDIEDSSVAYSSMGSLWQFST